MSIFQVTCIVGIAITTTITLVIFLMHNEDEEGLSNLIAGITLSVLMGVAILFMFMGATKLIVWR